MANIADYLSYLRNPVFPSSVSTASLWQHQEAMLTFSSSMPYSLLYAGMSTGKTLVALRTLEQFNGLRVVLSPAKPMGVYKEDYETFYPVKPFELFILNNGFAETVETLSRLNREKRDAVAVISYNTAAKIDFTKYDISAMIADEIHHIGIYNSTWSLHLAKSCSRIPFKMGMSGTPFHDARERLYGIYRWFDPILFKGEKPYPQARLFGHYDNFVNNFCEVKQSGRVRYITGYKNTEELLKLIRPTCLQIKTEDVIELPDLVIRRYPVELSKETRKAYNSLKDDAIIPFDDDTAILAPHIMTRVLRLQQLTASGELEDDQKGTRVFDIKSRTEKLESLLDSLGSEPVIIFTRFKKDVENISKLLPKGSYSLLTGGTDTHEQWKKGETQYLLANVASGSEGVRLTRAQHIIIWSLSYSLKEYEQLIARIRRHGQKSNRVFIHILAASNTVDIDILDAIERKSRDVDELDRGLRE